MKNLFKFLLPAFVFFIINSADAQTAYSFNTCGATGRQGPTQSQVNSNYTFGNSLYNSVTINTQGIQEWTVPLTGTYTIEVAGAGGGDSNSFGGRGRKIKGDVFLTAGTVLKIVVGQKGNNIGCNVNIHSSGGGGGSFVVAAAGNMPILIAGGGAGFHLPNLTSPFPISDGSFNSSGNNSSDGTGIGGISGNGGRGSNNGWGAGGGGFYTNGTPGYWNASYGFDGKGYSFLNGALGGFSMSYVSNSNGWNADGGFGGGGGAHGCTGGGGGGGGYSGGGGSNQNISQNTGGGGGSFIANNVSNATNLGLNLNNGYVTIIGGTDTQAPVISTNGDQMLVAAEGSCEVEFLATATATDNSSVGAPTGIRSDGKPLTDPYPVGETTITWNVTDVNGNPATPVVQTISVSDTQVPVISTNGDQNLNAETGLCEASFTATASATDNCSVGNPTGIRSDGKPLTDPYPVGETTITWNVTDVNGNPATSVVQTITVTDTQVPVISTNGDQNLNAETGLCEASFTATASATDNCSVGNPTGIRSDGKPLTEAYPVGITSITWNVIDINGNPASPVIQTITVSDTQVPVISTNGDQNLDAETGLCEASFTATASATDNCSVGNPTGVRSDGKALTEAYPVGETTITWNVTDINGNPATPVIQTITVTDTQAPVISTNGDQNLNAETGLCEASFTATASATDNCSVGASTGIRSDGKPLTEAYPVGITSITWNVTDINGNPATPVIQTITVSDTQVPVISTNVDQNLNAETGLCEASFTATASATDNCSVGNPTGIRSDGKPLTDPYPVGETTITWNVTDINGNPATPVVQTISVSDTQVPVISTNGDQNLNAESGLCEASFTATASATDNCSVGAPTGIRSDNKPLTDPYPVGITTITWNVTDINGNPATPVVQTITVTDTQVPVISTNGDQNLNAEEGLCEASFTATASATDNCSVGSPTGIRSDNKPLIDPYPVGETTITWNVTDSNGNPATPVVQTITVTDTQAPVISTNGDQNLNAEAGLCEASFTATASAADNCSVGNPTGIRSDGKPLTEAYPVGETTITWNVTDINGNPATPVVQTITVTDTQVPVISTNGDQNLNAETGLCEASFTATASATDNCSVGNPTGIRSDSKALTEAYPVGETTITWNVTDSNGNPATPVIQTITVTDTQVPVISTNGDQNLDAETGLCEASFTATASATDNCSVGSPTGIRSDNKPLTDPYPVGETTITWNVTDINGNPATPVIQTIMVTDTQIPVISTNGDQNLNAEEGLCEASFTATASATDNCSVGNPTGVRSDGKTLTEAYPVGETTITWNVTDINGNPATPVIQTISVTDTQVPMWQTATGELDRTVFCGQDQAFASAQNLQPIAFDNCTLGLIQKTSGVFVPTGSNGAGTYTNTWVATDGNSNLSEVFTQVITIVGIEIDASASGTPVQLGSAATLSATVTPNVAGVMVNFYLDGVLKGSSVTNISGIATLSVPGLQLNVYKVEAKVGNGCSESIAYLPVYDPNGSFVTGGGWINSPEGALIGTTTVGKASFGFVSKYKKGSNQVDGNTEFQFKAGNLNFKSTLHETGTLVISGRKATYRGDGTINGVSGFKFTITAIDGNWNGGTSPDQFRIKIWGGTGVIYDNGLSADDNSDASTVLGGGSIVIHETKAKGTKRVSAELITVAWNTPLESIKQKVDLMSATWFESRKLALTLDASAYDPLTPGFYELKADLVENEFFDLDEPISIQVLVQDKPKALDIELSGNIVAKDIANGTVIGNLSTIDPADDIHTYSIDAHPDLDIQGNRLIWKGRNIPAAQMKVTVFSTDRVGQIISKEIILSRELKPGEFFLYPNPAMNETKVMLDMDQPAMVAFEVYDAIGRLVIQDEGYKEGSFTHTLKLDGLAPGMYTVQLKVGNMVMYKRLIKY